MGSTIEQQNNFRDLIEHIFDKNRKYVRFLLQNEERCAIMQKTNKCSDLRLGEWISVVSVRL